MPVINEKVVYERPGELLTNNGILLLTKEFNQENIMPLVARIMEWNLLPEKLRPAFITLVINSPVDQCIAPSTLLM